MFSLSTDQRDGDGEPVSERRGEADREVAREAAAGGAAGPPADPGPHPAARGQRL